MRRHVDVVAQRQHQVELALASEARQHLGEERELQRLHGGAPAAAVTEEVDHLVRLGVGVGASQRLDAHLAAQRCARAPGRRSVSRARIFSRTVGPAAYRSATTSTHSKSRSASCCGPGSVPGVRSCGTRSPRAGSARASRPAKNSADPAATPRGRHQAGPRQADDADQLVADVDRHQVAREGPVVASQEHRLDIGLDRVDDRVRGRRCRSTHSGRARTRSRRPDPGRRPATPRYRPDGRRTPGRPGSAVRPSATSSRSRVLDPTYVLAHPAVATATGALGDRTGGSRAGTRTATDGRRGQRRGHGVRRRRPRRTRSARPAPRPAPAEPVARCGAAPQSGGPAHVATSLRDRLGNGHLPSAVLGEQRDRRPARHRRPPRTRPA